MGVILPQFLLLMVDLELQDSRSWTTMTGGTVTFHLWSPKL